MSSEQNTVDMADGKVIIEDRDDPDGILKKKKKNKNKVSPEDLVTAEDEKESALRKILELEKELLDMKSLKDDGEEEIRGLKYELKGLQRNFKDLQESSAKSLEDLEKFEVRRLTEENEQLKKENEELVNKQKEDQNQHESMKTQLKGKQEEIDVIQKVHETLKSKLKESKQAHEDTSNLLEQSKSHVESLKDQLKVLEEKQAEETKALGSSTKEKEKIHNIEKDSIMKELHQVRDKHKVASSEIEFLKRELEKLVLEKDNEKIHRVKTGERLKMLIKEKNDMEERYKKDLEQMSNDFDAIKKQLIHITSDKADMFEKLSDLILERKNNLRWVKDEETTGCTNCNEKFTMTFRRHHCRLCGHIFCNNCSNRWLLTPHSSKRVRSCDVCADAYTEIQSEYGDQVDAPAEYRELKGEEIEKYEIEDGEEESDVNKDEQLEN